MTKKTFIILLLVLIATVILGTLAFATIGNNEEQEKILTGKKIMSVQESYKEVEDSSKSISNSKAVTNDNAVLNKANEYLENINVDSTTFTTQNSTIQKFNNALESKQELVISNEKATIKIDSQTGELLSFVNNKNNFTVNTLSDTAIQQKAIEIFNNLDNIDKENYKLLYVEKFDDEIWRAGFGKKYGDLINSAESVKFSFCPQTSEIVTLAVNRIEFDDNKIVISENDARRIAQPYLNKSIATNMDIKVEIVNPNYFYEEASDDGSIYANINRTRRAYICTFNNESKSQVFIDCTTGEVIGGNMIAGGEY